MEKAGHRALGESWLPLLQGELGEPRGAGLQGMWGPPLWAATGQRELVLPQDLVLQEGASVLCPKGLDRCPCSGHLDGTQGFGAPEGRGEGRERSEPGWDSSWLQASVS